MTWPTAQDYNDAVQTVSVCFRDTALATGTVELTALQLPKPVSGNFAIVYHVSGASKQYAVRCFRKDISAEKNRYHAVSQFIRNSALPYFVPFDFFEEGILVKGSWHPIVKMSWIKGESLTSYVSKSLSRPQKLIDLALAWNTMSQRLRAHGIAHGDIQHGNVLITGSDEIVLVDYDGMYVPALNGSASVEIGHRNYQHPRRSPNDFGPTLDNFSEWVVYVALLALADDPSLWSRYGEGDERLLFTRTDFENPSGSALFDDLSHSRSGEVAALADDFKQLLSGTVAAVPRLPGPIAPRPAGSPARVPGAATPLPDWISVAPETSSTPSNSPLGGQSWILDHLPTIDLSGSDPPLTVERAALAFMTILAALILGVSVVGLIGAWVLTIAALVSFLAGAGLLGYRYLCRPTTVAYRASKARLASTAAQRRRAQASVAHAERQLADERKRMIGDLGSAQTGMDKLAADLNSQIASATRQLSAALVGPRTELAQIDGKEAAEIRSGLQEAKRQALKTLLSRHTLSSATIAGVGANLKGRLAYHGVRTAADFEGVEQRIAWYGSHRKEVVELRIAGRGLIHVEGIGPAKGSDLRRWRESLEQRYAGSLPSALGQGESGVISRKFDSLRAVPRSEERRLHEDARRRTDKLRADADARRAPLETAMRASESKWNSTIQTLQAARDARLAELSPCEWKAKRAERELVALRDASPARYVRSIFGISK